MAPETQVRVRMLQKTHFVERLMHVKSAMAQSSGSLNVGVMFHILLVRHSSVYHPQSNPVERFHRTLKRLLRVLCLDAGSEWDKHLPSILLALRTVSHESTGYTPSELVYGKNLRTPETLVIEHWMEPEEEGDLVTEYMFKSVLLKLSILVPPFLITIFIAPPLYLNNVLNAIITHFDAKATIGDLNYKPYKIVT
ncbi:retrovirus-related Pol polyprotein from transposon 17.6 [Trichonephila clavipes]|nr:retrovirus-related Pol polyprotein from transposon 17.6 [Trichonephila clavipes]